MPEIIRKCIPLAILLAGITCHAQLVAFTGTQAVASGALAPGSSSDYFFFGNSANTLGGTSITLSGTSGSQPAELTNFALSPGSTVLNNSSDVFQYAGNSLYPHLQPPGGGTSFQTGVMYYTMSSSPANFLDFTTTQGGSFDIFLLYGNAGAPYVDASFTLASDSDPANSATASIVEPASTKNEFVEFSISGATANEKFDLTVTPGSGDRAYLGGITFLTVPEPSTWALAAGGLGVALAAGRIRERRRSFGLAHSSLRR